MRWRSDSLKANLCQAQQRDLKTIAPLSHRLIVFTDTIDYRTIGFLYYRHNPTQIQVKISSRSLVTLKESVDYGSQNRPVFIIM